MRDDLYMALLSSDFEAFLEKCFSTLFPADPFIQGRHIRAICWRLGQVLAGGIRRLVINVPPRCLKSIIVSVALPAWILGHDPTRRIICVSYNEELAQRHAANFRRVVAAAWYRQLFPGLKLTKDTDLLTNTSRGGFRQATSVGGTLTGLGGHYIFIDDPIKADEIPSRSERARTIEWYKTTLSTRLDDPMTGAIILLMQRLHMEDLSGFLVGKTGWDHLRLPAIADIDQHIQLGEFETWTFKEGDLLHPERLTLAYLDEKREEQGPYLFSAQFMQTPVPLDGNMIKRDWLHDFDPATFAYSHGEVIQSWDVASKPGTSNDYSVCVTGVEKRDGIHVIDVARGKREFPQLERWAIELAERYRPNRILIEDSSSGTPLIQVLRQKTRLNIIPVKPKKDKQFRVIQATSSFEAGRVRFARQAAWLGALEQELLEFPAGRHDDQVDALTQLILDSDDRKEPRHPVPWVGGDYYDLE